MATIHSASAPPLVNPIHCPACNGAGWRADADAPCDACDGLGEVRHVEPADTRIHVALYREPTRSYVACSGVEVIEEGLRLADFVQEMLDGWEDGDLAIWMTEDQGSPRLVAVIRQGLHGATVTYLCEVA